MKRIESIKRLIILHLSSIGLILQTGVYAYFWLTEYYPFLHMHRRLNFYRWGHVLMFFLYFVLLFFFSSTYGGLKIGYLKPVEVYFSQVFSLAAVNIFSYLQLSADLREPEVRASVQIVLADGDLVLQGVPVIVRAAVLYGKSGIDGGSQRRRFFFDVCHRLVLRLCFSALSCHI